MKRTMCRLSLYCLVAALMLAAIPNGLCPAQERPGPDTRTLAEAFDEVLVGATTAASPSVVGIKVTRKSGKTTAPAPPRRPGVRRPFKRGTGPVTGVILTSDGYIITSLFNVSGEIESIRVKLSDGTELDGKLLGTDRARNLALLKIQATDLPVPKMVDKNEIRVGQWALALGRSFPGETANASLGIVSATNRIAGRAIQTDAAVGPGNYGGALVDIEGRLMGILTPMGHSTRPDAALGLHDSGIGFAVPIGDIMAELDQLKAGKIIRPAFLGIRFNTGLVRGGARVEEILPDTGAEKAGLKADDVIIEFDGKTIKTPFQLLHAIGSCTVGDKVEFKVKRNKKTLKLTVTLGARPDDI